MIENRLLEIGKRVLAESDIRRVLTVALDGVIELCAADRGMILLAGPGGETLFEEARGLGRQDIENPEFEVSRTILEKVRSEGTAFWSPNVLEDPALGARRSVLRLRILSMICLPIRHGDEVFGLVYLDNRRMAGVFTAETLELVESFADLISLAAFHALERRRLNDHVEDLSRELRSQYRFDAIIGQSPQILETLRLVSQVADSEATVLILGESGTGKELIARAIHYNSRRRDRPFVAINCGALPEQLLDAELFGHVRGAYTGAVTDSAGWFERAAGGTIFLDEIGEMSPGLQTKMLRVLEVGEYARVGSTTVRTADARVVAATNRDLAGMVREGKMREDLFYRLNVVEIRMPPLRERRGDLLLLARAFLARFNEKHGKSRELSAAAEELLQAYDYPGNVRELQNAIQRAVLLSRGALIEPGDLPASFRASLPLGKGGAFQGFRAAKRRVIEEFERDYITRCLREAEGNISQAARAAGIDVKNFYDKMSRYGIDALAFKKSRPGA
ncbi:MAG TPA: sigma 54-interacting transcriptional regulator [Thermoanaerobaculia bacterium]|nr:sigma 54-interacting transcriptional regulator [Thermoanaerobaculia bacterium]